MLFFGPGLRLRWITAPNLAPELLYTSTEHLKSLGRRPIRPGDRCPGANSKTDAPPAGAVHFRPQAPEFALN